MSTLKNRHEGKRRVPFYKDAAFWRGVASVFNITGYFTPRYYGRDPHRADYDALRGDWEAIGWDMEKAVRRFEAEHAKEIEKIQQKRLFDPDGN